MDFNDICPVTSVQDASVQLASSACHAVEATIAQCDKVEKLCYNEGALNKKLQ